MNEACRSLRRRAYRLLADDEFSVRDVRTLGLPGGHTSLPIFSFEEEAEMFLTLDGLPASLRAIQTAPGELISMLRTVLSGVEWVTLDPFPEDSCLQAARLLTIRRQDFAARLERRHGLARVKSSLTASILGDHHLSGRQLAGAHGFVAGVRNGGW